MILALILVAVYLLSAGVIAGYMLRRWEGVLGTMVYHTVRLIWYTTPN